MFEMIGVETDLFNVRLGNKKVLRVHKLMGAKITSNDECNYYLSLAKEDFEKNKTEIINLINS